MAAFVYKTRVAQAGEYLVDNWDTDGPASYKELAARLDVSKATARAAVRYAEPQLNTAGKAVTSSTRNRGWKMEVSTDHGDVVKSQLDDIRRMVSWTRRLAAHEQTVLPAEAQSVYGGLVLALEDVVAAIEAIA